MQGLDTNSDWPWKCGQPSARRPCMHKPAESRVAKMMEFKSGKRNWMIGAGRSISNVQVPQSGKGEQKCMMMTGAVPPKNSFIRDGTRSGLGGG